MELTVDIRNALDDVRAVAKPEVAGNLWPLTGQMDAGYHHDWSVQLRAALRQLQEASHVLDRAFGVGQS